MIAGTTNVLLSIDPMTGTEPSLSILINIDGDTLQYKPNCYRFKKEDKFTWGRANESLQYDFANNAFFKEEFSDTVFSINKESNKFIPALIFDSHGKGFSPEIRYDREYAKNHANEVYWVYSIMETHRYVIYACEHYMSRNKVLYDKVTGKKFKIALKEALKDDIAGGPVLNPDFYSEGKVLSSVEALTLKNYIDGEDFKNVRIKKSRNKEEIIKLASSLSETDNPVLITVTPKE